jgi:hypothetical protein
MNVGGSTDPRGKFASIKYAQPREGVEPENELANQQTARKFLCDFSRADSSEFSPERVINQLENCHKINSEFLRPYKNAYQDETVMKNLVVNFLRPVLAYVHRTRKPELYAGYKNQLLDFVENTLSNNRLELQEEPKATVHSPSYALAA